MATVLGNILEVAQIYAPRTDRAVNLGAEGAVAKLRRYSATRHPSDLALLPLHEGRTPRLYGVRMITAAQLAAIAPLKGIERAIMACRVGVEFTRDPSGNVERAAEEPTPGARDGALRITVAAWVDRLQALGGVQLAMELAEVVQRRAEIGDIEPEDYQHDPVVGGDPLDLYAPPSGLRLPR